VFTACEKQDAGVTAPQPTRAPADAALAQRSDAAIVALDATQAAGSGENKRMDDQLAKQLLADVDEAPHQPPAAFTACTHDDECVVTRSSCGTSSFAVHRAHADEAKAAAERLCKHHAAADVLDVKPIPVCKSGTCVNAARGATRH
jgi:hypothetical protein